MLTITVPGIEYYDEPTRKFIQKDGTVLELEHSLVSLSKWESIYEKPFLDKEEKSGEEIIGYIKAMVLTPDFPPDIFARLSDDNIKEVDVYINAKMSATFFNDKPRPRSFEIITSELIYYWLIVHNVSFECQHWHLNRLLTLLKICNLKAAPPKKLSRGEIAARNRELNKQRQQQYKTKG